MSFVKIYNLEDMSKEEYERIMNRASTDLSSFMDKLKPVVEDVKNRGDSAVIEYSEKFDKVKLSELEVSRETIKEAYDKCSADLIEGIKQLAGNVRRFHEAQLPKEIWEMELSPGLRAGQVSRPIEKVGCYAPGGRGWFPSTVLMTVIPAKVAGCKEVILCSPPDPETGEINPGVLVAADIAGADRVFRIGGAQSIAAMAYGTESVPKVYKIVGPGGSWIVAAKMLVFGTVDIDMPAGPGEGMVLADEGANPAYIASGMLVQAEHGFDSAAVGVVLSTEMAEKVKKELESQVEALSEYRQEFAKSAIEKYGGIVVAKDMDAAIKFVDDYAAEHLELQTKDPMETMSRINNAGAFYLGNYSPISAGCFCSGPNHTLPTGQGAKMWGGLNTEDFIKKHTFEFPSKEGLRHLSKAMTDLADYEGFPAHRNAIKKRLE